MVMANIDQNLHDLITSLDNRLRHLEDGFESTHDQEGVYERLRKLERYMKIAKWVIVTIGGAVITTLVKILIF